MTESTVINAINRVLRTESECRDQVEACRQQAERLRESAHQQVNAIEDLAEQRVNRVQAIADLSIAQHAAEIRQQIHALPSEPELSTSDQHTLHTAIQQLTRELIGDAK